MSPMWRRILIAGGLAIGVAIVALLAVIAFALLSEDNGGQGAEVARVTATATASPAATATPRRTPTPPPPTSTPQPTPEATPQPTEGPPPAQPTEEPPPTQEELPPATPEPPVPTEEPPPPTAEPPAPTEEPPPPTLEPTPTPTPAPTPTPSAPEIETALATLLINEVQLTDRFPPDCNPERPYSCFETPQEGYQLLIVWLERKDGGDPGEVGDELIDLCQGQEVYVIANDGSRIDCAGGGMLSLRPELYFATPASAHDFKLFWPGNPPIDLGI